MADQLKKYLFKGNTVRVQAVRLEQTWQDANLRHQYPPAIQKILGELMAAATLLCANIKFDGTLAMQLQGDGAISLLVVECQTDLSIRATVKLRENASMPLDGDFQSIMNYNGQGRFALILDPANKQPGQQAYQGVVGLVGESVAEVLEHYMMSSEQLQTRLWLEANNEHAAGLLLQQLPAYGGHNTEDNDPDLWPRVVELARTLKTDELLNLESDELIHRLFWQETLLTFPEAQVNYRCHCSLEKVQDVLRMLGSEEIDQIIQEQGTIKIQCDYCMQDYIFDQEDCQEIFSPSSSQNNH